MRGQVTIPLDLLTTLKEPSTLRFFLWCLVQATAVETTATVRGQALTLSPGQFIFNRRRATIELEEYGLTERKIRTALSRCVASQKVSQKTSQKITTITVINFSTYGVIASESVPINVPINVPTTEYKTGKAIDASIISNSKNTTKKRNTKNIDKHIKLQPYIQRVFDHYRKTFPTFGRTVRPGHKEWNRIGDRIKNGYSVDECISAINGNSVDPWYRSKGLHSLRYIFRDTDLMDRFILTWQNHHQPVISEKAKRGAQAAHAWANMKEETHG